MNDDLHAEKRVRGGLARAKALTPAKRSEIAKKAAKARWDPSIPAAEHGSEDRPLRIGEIELGCYVLNDAQHTRVFSQRGMLGAFGLVVRGGELQKFIRQLDLAKYLAPDVIHALENPLTFQPPRGGPLAQGYAATLLIDLCNAILEARRYWPLPQRFRGVDIRAEVILKAVAKTGIIALVDEATGYDELRTQTLQAILDAYLRKELAAWSKQFPDEFYEQIFRLRGWVWKGRSFNPPGVVAHYTKDLVYSRLAPGILPQLEKLNPKVGKHRRGRYPQWLTEDIGLPALSQHLYTVVRFMRASDSWDQLMVMMNRALPRLDENMKLPLLEWGEEQVAGDEDGDAYKGR